MTAGDTIRISYYNTPDTGTLLPWNLGWSGQTYDQIALAFVGASLFSASFPPDIVIKQIEFIPLSPNNRLSYTLIDLTHCKLHFDCKSTLKFQNRSQNQAGGDEESVDNVPLYGKSYYGIGNGTGAINRNNAYAFASRDFICDDDNGVIAKVPTESFYQEPIGPELLEKVKYHGKVHLDPGHLKTSSLTDRFSVDLTKFIRMAAHDNTSIQHHRHYFGSYRFMMLEKMLAAASGSVANSIKLGYEVNERVGCYCTVKNSTITVPLLSVANYTAEA